MELTRTLRVAILGNPNTGKSTLFNALTGLNVRTGNYPGVTVEKRLGKAKFGEHRMDVVDLPGAYSLSPQARDELIAVEVVLGMLPGEPPPDVLLCIVSAENLERHLFVVSQALDLGVPVVLALNMWDAAVAKQVEIDVDELARSLGIPVVVTEAHRKRGIAELGAALAEAATRPAPVSPRPLPATLYAEVEQLQEELAEQAAGLEFPRFFLERAILDVAGPVEREFTRRCGEEWLDRLQRIRERLQAQGISTDRVEAQTRYAWLRKNCLHAVSSPVSRPSTRTDKLDAFLTHWFFGLVSFLGVMFLVFQAIFVWALPMMDGLEWLQNWAIASVEAGLPAGPLRSMLTDSVIAGAGTVLLFIPQIALLFLFIAILEDCGYMPRVAFMLDRFMSSIGLNGKSFIPLMSSFACAIPGVMAARTIENPRDRLITILVAPLMSCSARLPVYLLLIAAFIPPISILGGTVSLQGVVLLAMSSLGAVVAIPIAWLFRKTLLKGDATPFMLELPEYKIPSVSVVLGRVVDRVRAFIVRAGTLIVAASILIWAAGYFPGDRSQFIEYQRELAEVESQLAALDDPTPGDSTPGDSTPGDSTPGDSAAGDSAADASTAGGGFVAGQEEASDSIADTQSVAPESAVEPLEQRAAELQALINAESARLLEVSFLGRIGHAIEPAVLPLGWDWRIGVSAIAAFPAREVVISTMGTIYSLGGEVDEEDSSLIQTMRSSTWPDGSPIYNIPVALSIMVFFALCAQCMSTLLIIRRETGTWWWPTFCFIYMTALAYVGALLTYQIGRLFL